jgi:hypothetical protein
MRKTTDALALDRLGGWDSLDPSEQQTVIQNSIAVLKARQAEGQSVYEIGRHLITLREILYPRKMWTEFLRFTFRMSVATGFRYIKYTKTMDKKLSPPIIDVVIEMGYSIPLKALEASRPPKTEDKDQIVRYLDRLSARPARTTSIEVTPDFALKNLLNEVILTVNKLPPNGRTRQAFLTRFIGMVLAQHGYSQETTFSPVEFPDEFRVFRGRPRLTDRSTEVA